MLQTPVWGKIRIGSVDSAGTIGPGKRASGHRGPISGVTNFRIADYTAMWQLPVADHPTRSCRSFDSLLLPRHDHVEHIFFRKKMIHTFAGRFDDYDIDGSSEVVACSCNIRR